MEKAYWEFTDTPICWPQGKPDPTDTPTEITIKDIDDFYDIYVRDQDG